MIQTGPWFRFIKTAEVSKISDNLMRTAFRSFKTQEKQNIHRQRRIEEQMAYFFDLAADDCSTEWLTSWFGTSDGTNERIYMILRRNVTFTNIVAPIALIFSILAAIG
jgi:hypothetical protein